MAIRFVKNSRRGYIGSSVSDTVPAAGCSLLNLAYHIGANTFLEAIPCLCVAYTAIIGRFEPVMLRVSGGGLLF